MKGGKSFWFFRWCCLTMLRKGKPPVTYRGVPIYFDYEDPVIVIDHYDEAIITTRARMPKKEEQLGYGD